MKHVTLGVTCAQEIKDITVKGLEAEVHKLLARHKSELAAVQQAALEDARRQHDIMQAQHELAARQMKERMNKVGKGLDGGGGLGLWSDFQGSLSWAGMYVPRMPPTPVHHHICPQPQCTTTALQPPFTTLLLKPKPQCTTLLLKPENPCTTLALRVATNPPCPALPFLPCRY